jgi:hypothetical protein
MTWRHDGTPTSFRDLPRSVRAILVTTSAVGLTLCGVCVREAVRFGLHAWHWAADFWAWYVTT